MAISKSPTQITFSAANSGVLAADSQLNSDTNSLASNSVTAMITCKVETTGTPTAGDTVDFYARFCTGDPDGSGDDEFDSVGHALHLMNIDLTTDNPAQKTVTIPVSAKSFKLYIDNNSSGLSVTSSAEYYETIVS